MKGFVYTIFSVWIIIFPLPGDYISPYSENFKELQLGIEHIDLNTILNELQNVDRDKARKIGERWISDAKNINANTNEKEVFEAAKLYMSMKRLIEKKGASGKLGWLLRPIFYQRYS